MLHIPINKRTGVRYPPITAEYKDAYEHPNSAVKGKYKFEPLEETKQAKAPPPLEAKAVENADQKEK